MISTDRLADVFVEVADTLVDEFDLIDFLHNLAGHAAEVTDGAAVGIVLTDLRDNLHHIAASTEDARLLELLQLQSEAGPCVDCFRSGAPVAAVDVRTEEERWPLFVPQALAAGILSVHAFPMRLRDRALGALNVFGTTTLPIGEDRGRVIQALADVATIAIMQERALARADVLTEQLQYALNSRLVIEQAKGAVARTFDISVDTAFSVMRRHARTHQIRLTDLAQRLVTDRTAMAELSAH